MKKILSLVLVLSLVLGSFSMAFATPSDVEGTDFATPVDVLMSLKVVTGYPDGTFAPEGNVTRAEMATMIVKTLGLGDVANFVGASGFSDTTGHWADKYIAVVAGQKVVNGYPDGTFNPNAPVTFPEAITMIVRALGYTDDAASVKGTWPVNYIVKANDLDITDDVVVDLQAYANRGAVAQMLYNCLGITTVTLDADGAEDKTGNETIAEKLNAEKQDDKVIPASWVGDADKTLIDLSGYVYNKVDYYENDDDEVIAIVKVESDTKTGTFKINTTLTDSTIELDDEDETLIDLDGLALTTDVFFNNAEDEFQDIDTYIEGMNVTVIGELKDGDDEVFQTISGIIAWAPTNVYFADSDDLDDIESAEEDGKGSIFNVLLPTVNDKDKELDMDKITVTGAVTALADIAEEDIVYVYENLVDKDVKFEVIRDTKDIEISKRTTSKVYDGSDSYEESKITDTADMNSESTAKNTFGSLAVGTSYKLFLDKDGKVFKYETTSDATDMYALYIDNEDKGTGLDASNAKIQVFTATGEKVVYEVKKDAYPEALKEADSTWATAPAVRTLLKYTVNSDGIVDDMEAVTVTAQGTFTEYVGKTATVDNTFFASDVVMIDTKTGTDGDDWKIVTSLEDEATYKYNYTFDDGKFEYFVITDSTAAASDSIYFAANAIYEVKNSDDDTVFELEGFEKGAAKTVYTDDADVTAILAGNTDAPAVYEVSYTSGEVTIATDAAFTVTGTVVSADSNYIKVGTTVYEYDSTVYVYEEVYDDSTLDSYKVADSSDIDKDDQVWFVYDATDGIQLVVVKKEADI